MNNSNQTPKHPNTTMEDLVEFNPIPPVTREVPCVEEYKPTCFFYYGGVLTTKHFLYQYSIYDQSKDCTDGLLTVYFVFDGYDKQDNSLNYNFAIEVMVTKDANGSNSYTLGAILNNMHAYHEASMQIDITIKENDDKWMEFNMDFSTIIHVNMVPNQRIGMILLDSGYDKQCKMV